MTIFDSTKEDLPVIIRDIKDGSLQLPDFQRGWVWDDPHIRALLVSVARSFPIGAVMLLESGGVKFEVRPIENVEFNGVRPRPRRLILDGQQRLTSLTQVLALDGPVTYQTKGRDVSLHYYIDIDEALRDATLENAFVAVDADKKQRTPRREVVRDLSTPEKEYEEFMFPCNQALDFFEWGRRLRDHSPGKSKKFDRFCQKVLMAMQRYELPVISLRKSTSKEAVCFVFENVNTGAVKLTVFELLTAMYAASQFNLRDDWYGNPAKGIEGKGPEIHSKKALLDVTPKDFLQGICLINSKSRGKAVTARMTDVLKLELAEYKKWAKKVKQGYLEAAKFLRKLRIYRVRDLPYRSQVIPLAVILAELGEDGMRRPVFDKLRRWFWCGVFDESYGGAPTDTMIANDVEDLHKWLGGGSEVPRTIENATFHADRLLSLSSRQSAAFKGLGSLIQGKDFLYSPTTQDLGEDGARLDIHHIFPKKWCIEKGIDQRRYDSIINKTTISAKANRIIGGKAPSRYLPQIMSEAGVDEAGMEAILRSHVIDLDVLGSDDFDAFFEHRKEGLCRLIEETTGKAVDRVVQEGMRSPQRTEDQTDVLPRTRKVALEAFRKKSPAAPDEGRKGSRRTIAHTATIFGKTKRYGNATLAYIAAWNAMIKRKSDICEKMRHDTRFARTKWCFAESEQEAKQNKNKSAFYNPLANGWMVSTNLSVEVKRRRLRKAAKLSGFSFGPGKDINY